MSIIRLAVSLVFFFATSAPALAQELLLPKPVQITNSSTRMCVSPCAAWDGSQWGILYRSYHYSDYQVYFVRMTMGGKVVGGHKLLFKSAGGIVPLSFDICANENGWGLLLGKENYDTGVGDILFYRLGKKGDILGKPTIITSNKKNYSFSSLIWTGSHYMVFYEYPDASGKNKWQLAILNPEGSRIRSDFVYPNPLEGNVFHESVVMSPYGIAFFGSEYKQGKIQNPVFTRVGFGGYLLTPVKRMDEKWRDYLSTEKIVWNGFNFAVAMQDGSSYEKSKPYIRLVSPDGEWISKKKTIPNTGARFITDLASSGSSFICVSYDRKSSDLYYRVLDNELKPSSQYELAAGNVAASGIALYGNGNKVGMFMYYAPAWGIPTNVHYNALVMPHSGKPNIVYFKGRVINLFNKKYAMLYWRVDGVDSVTLKTKGYKGKKPANGVLILGINSESTFQLKTRNDSGRAKAKIQVSP